MEDDVVLQVQNRIKALLFDSKISNYRQHEFFVSRSNKRYQFLIWKLQPDNLEQFNREIQELIEKQGYQCIHGAWDVSTYNSDKKTGYKVVALYKPDNS